MDHSAFHAAVGDDDWALLEALQKTVPSLYFGGHIVSFQLARHIHPGFRPAGIGTLPLEAGCRGFTGPDPSASLDAERDLPAAETEYRHPIFRQVAKSTENG